MQISHMCVRTEEKPPPCSLRQHAEKHKRHNSHPFVRWESVRHTHYTRNRLWIFCNKLFMLANINRYVRARVFVYMLYISLSLQVRARLKPTSMPHAHNSHNSLLREMLSVRENYTCLHRCITRAAHNSLSHILLQPFEWDFFTKLTVAAQNHTTYRLFIRLINLHLVLKRQNKQGIWASAIAKNKYILLRQIKLCNQFLVSANFLNYRPKKSWLNDANSLLYIKL